MAPDGPPRPLEAGASADVVIVGAGTLFSSIAVILSHVWDYFSQQMHLHP